MHPSIKAGQQPRIGLPRVITIMPAIQSERIGDP